LNFFELSFRTFPVSIFGGLAMVMAIYLSVNMAYLTFLSPKEMIASNAVAFVSFKAIVIKNHLK